MAADHTHPGPQTILVVEDDPDHALLVSMAARRVHPDLDVRVLGKGEQAMAYLEGDPPFEDRAENPEPSLVILDLLLPGLGGLEFLEWMSDSSESPTRGIPVVVLSSSLDPGDRERSLELGARSFHSKPPDLDELGETVGTILRQWIR